MTKAEILALIESEVLQTSITADEFLRRVAEDPEYPRTITHYYKALKAAEQLKTVTPPPPPPPPPTTTLAGLAQRVIFCAHNPLAALGGRDANGVWHEPPSKYIPALTADPGYASFVDDSVVSQLRKKFPVVAAWGVQTQIGAQRILDFRAKYALNYCIFQGETSEEYRTAIEAGATVLVGNPNAWTQAQRYDATARINNGTLAVSFETYTNDGAPWPEASSSAGVPVASFCLGVYSSRSNPSLADYKAHTPAGAWPNVSVYHAAGVNPAEWGLLT